MLETSEERIKLLRLGYDSKEIERLMLNITSSKWSMPPLSK